MPNVLAFLSYVLAMTITPGPNNMMCLVNGSRFGFRQTLRFIAGIFAGVIVVMTACSYFNLSLSRFVPSFRPFAEALGGLYMLYLAVRVFKTDVNTATANARSATFVTGMAMQFVNAKMLLYGVLLGIVRHNHSAPFRSVQETSQHRPGVAAAIRCPLHIRDTAAH